MTAENRGSTPEVQMRSKFQTSALSGSNELNLSKYLKCGGLSGGPGRTRICDLYRVNVKQPLQNQQDWSQVIDSAFDRMGQKRPNEPAMGHNGPNFSGASPLDC